MSNSSADILRLVAAGNLEAAIDLLATRGTLPVVALIFRYRYARIRRGELFAGSELSADRGKLAVDLLEVARKGTPASLKVLLCWRPVIWGVIMLLLLVLALTLYLPRSSSSYNVHTSGENSPVIHGDDATIDYTPATHTDTLR